jgi:hypothetical protein
LADCFFSEFARYLPNYAIEVGYHLGVAVFQERVELSVQVGVKLVAVHGILSVCLDLMLAHVQLIVGKVWLEQIRVIRMD